jgi:hypothetical protein
VGGDQPIDDGAARLQPGERANFVTRHQPAVAGDVGGENRRELSFDRWTHDSSDPPGAEYSRSGAQSDARTGSISNACPDAASGEAGVLFGADHPCDEAR